MIGKVVVIRREELLCELCGNFHCADYHFDRRLAGRAVYDGNPSVWGFYSHAEKSVFFRVNPWPRYLPFVITIA